MPEYFLVESSIKGIGWPGVPAAGPARTLSLVFQLDRTQWWPPDVLAEHQFEQLGRVVAHAQRIPFYKDRLAAIDVTSGKAITPEQWRQVPVLTRPEAQAASDALRSRSVPPDHGRIGTLTTSGSTGRPLRTAGTELTQSFWNAYTLRDHLWHKRDFSQKLATIRQFTASTTVPPHGARTQNWGFTTQGLVQTGPGLALHIDRSIEQQAEWLLRQTPGYLLTYPSNALALAEFFAHEGRELPGLLELRAFGEVLDPRVRPACRDAWGVPVVDMYTSQEVGYIALQCPENTNYHLQSEHLLVEILDDRGEPCVPGEMGRVVLTTLLNFATPMLRYEVGDYAEVGEPCSCGRGLPVVTRIMGRQRNMFVYPNGDRRWPILDNDRFKELARKLPRVGQFQVIQRTVDDLEMKLVAQRLDPEQERILREFVLASLRHPFTLTFTYVEEIPRSEGGKFEDFRSEVVQ